MLNGEQQIPTVNIVLQLECADSQFNYILHVEPSREGRNMQENQTDENEFAISLIK